MRWQAANPYPICFICSSMAFRVFWRACKLNIYIFISIHINAHPGVATPIHIYTGIYIYVQYFKEHLHVYKKINTYIYIYLCFLLLQTKNLCAFGVLAKAENTKKNDEWPSLEVGKPSRCFCLWNTRWHPWRSHISPTLAEAIRSPWQNSWRGQPLDSIYKLPQVELECQASPILHGLFVVTYI